ncbi:hypothetical protein L916_01139 [Phytophthora nicotianae]|uniref:SWIM-type domain-containing protein n=1 Tax=Phytophthora nicotianae TaxID=4792 RepID=W2JSM7_PHYNI|nr:hypothetical protein L916_01139 [Phytophthora nicotianae]
MALHRLYSVLTGHELVVQYAMADADQAQYNVTNAVFGNNPHFTSLMCFFHVMKRVYRAFPSDTKATKRIQLSTNKRSEEGIAVSAQMGVNYARMKFEGQPYGSWVIDTARMWCQCSYWFGFGACVHVLFAQRTLEYLESAGREILVARGKHRSGTVGPSYRDDQRGGRPLGVGPALTY